MQYLIVGLVAAVATAYLTAKVKALTLGGALEAAVIVFCSCFFGGWFGLVFLLSAYISIALVDHFLKGRPADNVVKEHGGRNFIQVAVNGLPATICIVLYGITENHAFLLGFAVAITEALADSVASDVGIFSKKDPVSICHFRRIPRGLSGGISLLGTCASFAATLFCAGLYFLFFFDLAGAAVVLLFGNVGCLIDSILGDLLQEKFQCTQCGLLTEKHLHCQTPTRHVAGIAHLDNSLVNLISNALAACAVVLILLW